MTNRLRRPLVLAVDDDPANLLVIEAALSPVGFEVIAAATPSEAEQQVRQRQPDIVLLDVMMPGESGIEACRRWRAEVVWRATPIVLLTALSAVDHRIGGLAAGADDYLEKPIDPEALARTARRWVATGRAVGSLPAAGDDAVRLAKALKRAAQPRRAHTHDGTRFR